MSALGCDFNRSTQHLISKYREGMLQMKQPVSSLTLDRRLAAISGRRSLRIYVTAKPNS